MRPKVLTRFEPWMALSFTEGSIGGDIERIDLAKLEAFYGRSATQTAALPDNEPRGSNGIAIAPALTRDGRALLLINPHTSFFFRSEQQVTSGEGLNAYGASTWGQFFIYQGFNSDARLDAHVERGRQRRRIRVRRARRGGTGLSLRRDLAAAAGARHHAALPRRGRQPREPQRPHLAHASRAGDPRRRQSLDRLCDARQSGRRASAKLSSGPRPATSPLSRRSAAFKANSSNNTLVATAKGEIAYLHPQFVPRRDDRFDYTGVVDGSDPATDWRGLHAVAELPNAINPATGWAQNTNAWPYRAAGSASPDPARFPRYMDTFGENYRGLHAHSC